MIEAITFFQTYWRELTLVTALAMLETIVPALADNLRYRIARMIGR